MYIVLGTLRMHACVVAAAITVQVKMLATVEMWKKHWWFRLMKQSKCDGILVCGCVGVREFVCACIQITLAYQTPNTPSFLLLPWLSSSPPLQHFLKSSDWHFCMLCDTTVKPWCALLVAAVWCVVCACQGGRNGCSVCWVICGSVCP